MTKEECSLKVRRILEKDYAGLKSLLDYVFSSTPEIQPNPTVLNIGGVNTQENEALYRSLGRARIDVIDVDEQALSSLTNDFIRQKTRFNAVNIPLLYFNNIRYDIVFSRHPPVFCDQGPISEVGIENPTTKNINMWDVIFKQMHYANPEGLTMLTFYTEKEYRHAFSKLVNHKPLKYGRNPRSVRFSKLDSRILFEAGKTNMKDVEVIRDNYFLFARNACKTPKLSELVLYEDGKKTNLPKVK